jgi:uncharacterized protein (DUF2141 family)
MRTAIAVLALFLSGASAAMPAHGAQPEGAAGLQIRVSNVRVARGHVHVAICPQSLFLKEECVYKAIVPAKEGETIAVIDGLPAGIYAAQVYFDENGNDELDRNFIGIPREGVGFSNDPSFTFRAPSFAETAFRFDGVSGSIRVRLRYY